MSARFSPARSHSSWLSEKPRLLANLALFEVPPSPPEQARGPHVGGKPRVAAPAARRAALGVQTAGPDGAGQAVPEHVLHYGVGSCIWYVYVSPAFALTPSS